jgi:hypothetical protein
MKAVLILVLLLTCTVSVFAVTDSPSGEVIASLITAAAVLITSIAASLVRIRNGSPNWIRRLNSILSSGLTQEEVDRAVEYALTQVSVNANLADIIGDIISSIYRTGMDGDAVSVFAFAKTVVSHLRAYSPDFLAKVFGTVSMQLTVSNTREAFLYKVENSPVFIAAVHEKKDLLRNSVFTSRATTAADGETGGS